MIRVTTLTSADQAQKYYNKSQNLEAYYSDNQEFNGSWGGKGAQFLGLKGYITEEAFSRLLDNQHPFTGKQLTPRMRADRRPGFDITCDVPKPVSLAWAYTKDERIIRVLRETVDEITREMEKDAATRVRAGLNNRADENRRTGNWIMAEYVHLTARPEDGYSDPHLHVHIVVPNATFDPIEKKWKALQMGNIHEEIQYYEGAYHRLLAEKLRALGLEIVLNEHAFDIAGISRDLIDKFSRRTMTINATAKRLGITDPAQKAKLGALTREKKNGSLLVSDLERFWWGNLSPEHESQLKAVATVLQRSRAVELSQELTAAMPGAVGFVEISRSSEALGIRSEIKAAKPQRRVSMNQKTRPRQTVSKPVKVTEHDRRAVELAIKHEFERASVVTEKQLTGTAFKMWQVGKATYAGIKQAVAEAPLLRRERNGRLLVTTREVWEEERRIIDRCLNGILQKEPMNEFWKIEDEELNAQQRKAILHVLNSRDFVTAIEGRAGTGKTKLLHELRRGAETGMNRFLVFAPTSEAARNVLRGEGFHNAETVARLLQNRDVQENARGAILLIDEAGMLSNPQMDELLELAERLGSRLVLGGDRMQHNSVQRGRALDLLANEGGMKVAHVNEIMRQRGAYKRLVEHVANRDFEKAFMTLDTMDAITEMPIAEMAKAAAKKYVEALRNGETVLVTSPTHEECDWVTKAIREELRAEKKLGAGVDWPILKNLNWTEAQKSDYDHYKNKRGHVVQINRHVKGFALGEQLEVIGVSDGMVRVRSKSAYKDKIKALPLAEAECFGVYERQTIEICEGERIRITCNSRTKDGKQLSNGNLFFVDYIDPDGRLVLNNGYRLDKSCKHLNYAFVPTSHAIQGKTVDRVIVVQTALSAAADANQFYVSISRGRKGVTVITDDIELLRENVSRVRDRMMATELLREESERIETKVKEPVMSSSLLGAKRESIAIEVEATKLAQEESEKRKTTVKAAARSSVVLGTQEENIAIEIEPPKREMVMEMVM